MKNERRVPFSLSFFPAILSYSAASVPRRKCKNGGALLNFLFPIFAGSYICTIVITVSIYPSLCMHPPKPKADSITYTIIVTSSKSKDSFWA